MTRLLRRTLHLAVLSTAALVATLAAAPPAAYAAVTMTIQPAAVAGSDFTWSCVVNAGGGTTYVAGASWLDAGGGFVETARIKVTGSTPTTVTYARDGDPNALYQYRCKAYPTATGGTATVSDKLDVTTYGDTRYGIIVSIRNEPDVTHDLAGWETEYTRHRAFMGNAPLGVRVYSSDAVPVPGESSPPSGAQLAEQQMSWIAAHYPDESVTVSFKAYDGTRLSSLLGWAQTNAVDVTVIYFHEVQDDWGKNHNPGGEPTLYKSIYHQMRTVIDASGWHAHTTLEKNLNWYYQFFNAPTLGADWSQYVEAKNANGTKADPADRVTWDAYSPLTWTHYAALTDFMQYPLAVWNAAAVPWGYGEFGIAPLSTPDTAWIAAVRGFADAARTPSLAGAGYAALPAAQTFKYWCGYANDLVHSYHLDQSSAAVAMYEPYVLSMPLSG